MNRRGTSSFLYFIAFFFMHLTQVVQYIRKPKRDNLKHMTFTHILFLLKGIFLHP